jgi:hypothetical protein
VSLSAVATSRLATIPSAQKQAAPRLPDCCVAMPRRNTDFSYVAPFHLSDTTAAEAKRQKEA